MNAQQQMEIPLKVPAVRRDSRNRQQRKSRAQWWFSQMRAEVDKALEWSASEPTQPHAF